jgi:GST-like protein
VSKPLARLRLLGSGSPNVLKILIYLEEAGLDYEVEWVDLIGGAQHDVNFRRFSPFGKVPVLIAAPNGAAPPAAVFESGAILIFLAERTGHFLARSGPDRHATLAWLMAQVAGLGPIGGQAIHFAVVAPENAYARARFSGALQGILRAVEARLEVSRNLGGEPYSIADMASFPWIRTLRRHLPSIARTPRLEAWYEAIKARPAVIRAISASKTLAARDKARFECASADEIDRYFGRI